MNNPPALKTHQLSVNYDKTPVLWDISLEIPRGKLVGIIGPNGAGKTTLIKTILGLIKPISGYVECFGEPVETVRQKIAYVPQRESVDWDYPITVKELVLMGRYGKLGLLRWPKKADYAAAEHYLTLVGMEKFAHKQISQLSGGQQQRVFLARALIQEADIYLMDEPFAGVDHATESSLVKVLRDLITQNKTVLVVHHDLNTLENYFDWLVAVNMRLVASGPTQDVYHAETLKAAYGVSYSLFDEALKLKQEQALGNRR